MLGMTLKVSRPHQRLHLIFSLTLSLGAVFATVSTASAELAGDYVEHEVLVKYKDGVFRSRAEVAALYDRLHVQLVEELVGSDGVSGVTEKLTLSEYTEIERAIDELRSRSDVAYAQPNYRISTPRYIANDVTSEATAGYECWVPGINFPPGCVDSKRPPSPNPVSNRPPVGPAPSDVVPPQIDPDVANMWGLNKIEALKAWQSARGSRRIIVASIDTGADYNHSDLAFNLWRNPNPTRNDVVGWDFVHHDALPYSDDYYEDEKTKQRFPVQHGCHVAGTIGATGGNGIGLSGVSPRVSLMTLKFMGETGKGTDDGAIRAIDYAIARGARIINASWGSETRDPALLDAILRAEAKGVLFVVAAGNENDKNHDGLSDGSGNNDDPKLASFPSGFRTSNMISVAATDSRDELTYFSNFGKNTVHLAAPGSKIRSLANGNLYRSMSGTSMAAPHVSGAAALIWSINPRWTFREVKAALLSTVDLVPGLRDKTITGGRLNVARAVERALKAPRP